MSLPYVIPLDLGDTTIDSSLMYLRRGVGTKHHGKIVAAYIGGAAKKSWLIEDLPIWSTV